MISPAGLPKGGMLLLETFLAADKPKPRPAELVCPEPPPIRLSTVGATALYAHTGAILELKAVGQNINFRA